MELEPNHPRRFVRGTLGKQSDYASTVAEAYEAFLDNELRELALALDDVMALSG